MMIHLDSVGGIAGDMFCAALLDARPELLERVQSRLAEVEPRLRVDLEPHPGHLRGSRFRVYAPEEPAHGHRHYSDILPLLERLPIGPREHAQGIFRALAEAEAFVHRRDVMAVAFHEVGNWDSIADIVSAAVLIDALNLQHTSSGPLPKGGGRVHTAHGWLPVPAPATAKLLEGFTLIDDGIPGERITPTGAAILRHLRPGPSAPTSVLASQGSGFGTRDLGRETPNCLRALLFEEFEEQKGETGLVLHAQCEIDDQSPEDLALGLENLRQLAGVLDVHSLMAIGKQGRMTTRVEILAQPWAQESVLTEVFRQTTTLGVRYHRAQRRCLPREHHQTQVEGQDLEVKTTRRPNGETSAKTELRSVHHEPTATQRARLRQAGEARVLDNL